MSRDAEALLEQFRKLSAGEQQELLQQLLHSLSSTPARPDQPFPTVKVGGGPITSKQITEVLDDE
jgi:hypothetical protein